MECIIFDFDGTLVDSEYTNCRALVDMFAEYAVELDIDVALERYKGAKLSRIIDEIESLNNVRVADNFVEEYRIRVEELYDDCLNPIPRVKELLESIEIEVCIASSAPRSKIKHGLKSADLSDYFSESSLFSSYEINSWKPEPDIFLFAAKSMRVSPTQCLVVDDAEIGVQAGLSAGMKTCYFNQDGKKSRCKAATSVADIYEVLTLLE